jgi:hypothetical protein
MARRPDTQARLAHLLMAAWEADAIMGRLRNTDA